MLARSNQADNHAKDSVILAALVIVSAAGLAGYVSHTASNGGHRGTRFQIKPGAT
jgi:hypothetical protein